MQNSSYNITCRKKNQNLSWRIRKLLEGRKKGCGVGRKYRVPESGCIMRKRKLFVFVVDIFLLKITRLRDSK